MKIAFNQHAIIKVNVSSKKYWYKDKWLTLVEAYYYRVTKSYVDKAPTNALFKHFLGNQQKWNTKEDFIVLNLMQNLPVSYQIWQNLMSSTQNLSSWESQQK